MSDEKTVIITADGACLGNGQQTQRAAAAAVLEFQGHRRTVATYIGGNSTNQQAEITAAALALESLKRPCTVILRTDSKYVVETMKGNFRRKSNLPLWQRLDNAMKTHNVSFEWVEGHAGNPEQEAADKVAKATAQLGKVDPVILTEAVARLNDEFTPVLASKVHTGLKYLAGNCDGANHRDGQGFNRFDADLGHHLASKSSLSARDVASGRRLCLRYRKQLESFDPSITAIL